MSRSLSLGNGKILVCFDNRGQLRDFYFHFVGLENQMYKGCKARVGVWTEGQFSDFESPDWEISVDYKAQTLVGDIKAINAKLEIEILITDVVYNEKDILIRSFIIKNNKKTGRNIKIFLGNEFHLLANKSGDTAYFDPSDNTIVHYKGRRNVVIGGQMENTGFSDYSVGVWGIEGKLGTWWDAMDGQLSQNPVEHGPADSVVSFAKDVDADSSFEFDFWYAIGLSLEEAKSLHSEVIKKTPKHIIDSTQNYWKAWLKKQEWDFADLGKDIESLYQKSLLIIRTHVDNNGAIIASGDSEMLQLGKDTYSYVWTRDGSFIAMSLDEAGYSEVTKRFFEFCNAVISEDGFFYHKYQPDKSLGSSWHPWILEGKRRLPIQEDETALVLISLWNHYQKDHDLELIESIYNSLIKKSANFMLGFRQASGLPSATYDLWEMKHGISTFTASAVAAALNCASELASLLGKSRDSKDYLQASAEIKSAIVNYLWDEESKYFYKSIDTEGESILHDQTTDASSFHGVFKFGILPIDDPKLTQAYLTLKEKLTVNTPIGGIARFEADVYFQSHLTLPGNPWFITCLWVAQYEIAKAKTKADLDSPKRWLEWVCKYAQPSGVLSEQLDPQTGTQLSAAPLIWSHAEFIYTTKAYLDKFSKLKK